MKIKDIYESTTSGSVASVAMPLGGTQKREGSMFKGKKTKKKFYEGKVKELMQDLKELSDEEFKKKYKKTKQEWRQALKEDEVNEADLILVPGHGNKLKPGFIPKDKDRTDHEVEMARSDLFQAAKNAQQVYKMIEHLSEDEGLEGWVQEKIIKANDYLNTIREYLEHKTYMQEAGVIAGGMSNFEEGYTVTRGIDRERYQERPGLEGPFSTKSGKVVYYDKIEGKYYDPDTDMYIEYDDFKAMNEQEVSEEKLDEKQDACYHKVKSRYKVWPSAYASGALVKCRKVGASNWGNSSKK